MDQEKKIIPDNELWYKTGNGKAIRNIERYGFGNCSVLSEREEKEWHVIVCDGPITAVGQNTFCGMDALRDIIIPDTVTDIKRAAFYYCNNLNSVQMPESLKTIDTFAFYNCSGLTSVNIGNSVTSIGGWAFYNCSGLTSVTIPNSVTSIGEEAFYNCSALTGRLTNLKKYYKGFYFGLVCRGYHFQEGVVNELRDKERKLSLCEYGFHFCDNPLSVFNFYCGLDGKNMVLWEVEPMGEIIHGDDHKHCCSKIRLVRRVPFSEIGKIIENGLKEEWIS